MWIDYHLPNLKDVILLLNGCDDEVGVGVPAEVWDLGSVTSMDELVGDVVNMRSTYQHLGWSVLGLLNSLLISDFAQIPNCDSSVIRAGGEQAFIEW